MGYLYVFSFEKPNLLILSRCRYRTWKKLVILAKLQCFLLFEILICLTSHITAQVSGSETFLLFFVATNWSVRIYRVSAQMCYVSLKLNLSGKIQVLKYWLTDTYSKCIIWGHSIITLLQNDQNLDTPSTFIGCTCLILVLYIDSHLF